jgi:hypothetical protein
MNVKHIFGAALVWSALAAPVLADNARIPYRLLYQAQRTQTDWNNTHTNLLVAMTIESERAEVKSSDFKLFIDAKAGQIPVEIRPGGEFTVPVRDDLLAEDDWIITNQPKGTVRLNWRVALLPGRLGRSFHYGRIMRPVRESETIHEQMRTIFPGSPKLTVTGLMIGFAPTDKAPVVTIHSKDGNRNLTANDRGEVIIPLTADLLEEDPLVTTSGEPGVVEIVSRHSAE